MNSPSYGRYFDPTKCIKITANIDVGLGRALFVAGEKIANGLKAQRMECVASNKWIFYVELNNENKKMNDTTFRFYIGPYEAGKHPDVSQLCAQNHRWCDFSLKSGEYQLKLGDFSDYFPSTQIRI